MADTRVQAGAREAVPDEDGLSAIELVGVEKEFTAGGHDVRAVERVDLRIAEGEFFSLLGPSGCGKTTTLRMIAGFEEPSAGQILLHGRDMVGVPPFRRDVNMVFQQYALFPHMDVFENVAFGLRRKKVDKDEIKRRVAEALSLVELEGREKRKPRQLSGGQQQRVALARALVNRPRALLLDEPLGALDLKLRQAMQLELKRIQREVGITFVYVTHDQEEALTMSDRLVVMNAGRIEQLGSPRELYEHPATRFVANFIGTSNVLTGRLERKGDGWALAGLGPDQRVLVADAGGARDGQDVELAIRPEKIVLRTEQDPPPPDRSALRVKVDEIVYLGTSTQYRTVTDGGDTVAVYRQNASATPGADVLAGQVGWLEWPPEHSYVLRGSTEEEALP
ncbi:MAG TPA: ABC transporter ATP-binding protein [Actinomycetota bacterium]|jgi:spermidine/putrescine transport system ATP-binding protein|nr:ABC transporter ATP-binding protein [Actinomycetota bacterium]